MTERTQEQLDADDKLMEEMEDKAREVLPLALDFLCALIKGEKRISVEVTRLNDQDGWNVEPVIRDGVTGERL